MHILSTRPELAQRTTVGVLHAHRELRMVALEAFDPGQAIVRLEGLSSPVAMRHTIQIGAAEHLQAPADASLEERLARHPWLFLNHSCTPNTRVVGRELVALRRIEAHSELAFDYETTEWQLAEPFTCRCGACGGRRVRGFRFLDRAERARRLPFLAAHLRTRLEDSLPA